MNDRQYAQYQSFVRVLAFTAEHTADFPASSPAGTAITEISRVTLALKPHTDGHSGRDSSGATSTKEDLIDALREDLKDISRTARAIEASSSTSVGFSADYSLPADNTQRSIISHARSVLAKLKSSSAHVAQFTAYELPADFVADLEADLAAYDAATETQAGDRISGVEGTATARELLKEGRAAVVQLNASVRNKYRRQPEILAAWRTASRVDRASAAKAPATPDPVSPP